MDNDLADVDAPAYIKELYRNLSFHPDTGSSDATVIRALPTLENKPGGKSIQITIIIFFCKDLI